MAVIALSSLSRAYVRCDVDLDRDGAAVDPTSPALPVEMALPRAGVTPSAWWTAAWEADGRGGWRARLLAGPGGTVTLPAGTYDVWVRVTSSPEVPVAQSADALRVV